MRQGQNDETTITAAAAARSRALIVAVALGIVYIVWGSTYLAIQVVVRDLPATSSASWRYLVAALPLWVIVYRAVTGDLPGARTTFGVVVGFGGLVLLIAASGFGGDVKV